MRKNKFNYKIPFADLNFLIETDQYFSQENFFVLGRYVDSIYNRFCYPCFKISRSQLFSVLFTVWHYAVLYTVEVIIKIVRYGWLLAYRALSPTLGSCGCGVGRVCLCVYSPFGFEEKPCAAF